MLPVTKEGKPMLGLTKRWVSEFVPGNNWDPTKPTLLQEHVAGHLVHMAIKSLQGYVLIAGPWENYTRGWFILGSKITTEQQALDLMYGDPMVKAGVIQVVVVEMYSSLLPGELIPPNEADIIKEFLAPLIKCGGKVDDLTSDELEKLAPAVDQWKASAVQQVTVAQHKQSLRDRLESELNELKSGAVSKLSQAFNKLKG